MARYLTDDAKASALARKLRGFSDRDLAWFPHLSGTNLALVCNHLDCSLHILLLAQQYETRRRRACSIPRHEVEDSAEPRGRLPSGSALPHGDTL